MGKARSCAYCGVGCDKRCKCKYRPRRNRIDGQNGGFCLEGSNISAETTLAEMLDSIRLALPVSVREPEKAVGVWRWSFDLARPAEPKRKAVTKR